MLSYHILPNGISLSYDGKVVLVNKSDKRHEKIIAAIRNGEESTIPGIVEHMQRYFDRHDGAEFVNGQVLIDGCEIPQELNHYILGLADDELPFNRMIKFWRRLQKSNRFGVRERLFRFLQRQEHPITEDGRFLAYRRVGVIDNKKTKKDGVDVLKFPNKTEGERILVDLHTRTIDNSVGETPYMDPVTVCDDPNITCAEGLHAASFKYASEFYGDGVLVEVAIAPEDVICVPNDYDGQKMRTCRYEVITEIDGPRSGPSVDLEPNNKTNDSSDENVIMTDEEIEEERQKERCWDSEHNNIDYDDDNGNYDDDDVEYSY